MEHIEDKYGVLYFKRGLE